MYSYDTNTIMTEDTEPNMFPGKPIGFPLDGWVQPPIPGDPTGFYSPVTRIGLLYSHIKSQNLLNISNIIRSRSI